MKRGIGDDHRAFKLGAKYLKKIGFLTTLQNASEGGSK
jgi:hypothetical protein